MKSCVICGRCFLDEAFLTCDKCRIPLDPKKERRRKVKKHSPHGETNRRTRAMRENVYETKYGVDY